MDPQGASQGRRLQLVKRPASFAPVHWRTTSDGTQTRSSNRSANTTVCTALTHASTPAPGSAGTVAVSVGDSVGDAVSDTAASAAASAAAAATATTAGDADRLCAGGTATVAVCIAVAPKPRRYARLSQRAQDEAFQARSFSSASANHQLLLLVF